MCDSTTASEIGMHTREVQEKRLHELQAASEEKSTAEQMLFAVRHPMTFSLDTRWEDCGARTD